MSSFRRKHGGSRQGSGRKLRSQTLGPPQSHSLTNYFSTTGTSSTANSNLTTTARRPTRQTATQNTSHTTTTAHTSQRTNATRQPIPNNVQNNVPNNNADEIVDESIFMTGKTSIKTSKNLRVQRETILSSEFYASACSNIEEKGILWWHPPQLIKKPTHNIKERWLDYFKLRIFNWIPHAMIGGDWKPDCPHCKKKLSSNGHKLEPRIVFDYHENYLLNAPNKCICRQLFPSF